MHLKWCQFVTSFDSIQEFRKEGKKQPQVISSLISLLNWKKTTTSSVKSFSKYFELLRSRFCFEIGF